MTPEQGTVQAERRETSGTRGAGFAYGNVKIEK